MISTQSGFLRKDIIVILLAGALLMGLFGYYAMTAQPVPIWQAALVGVVNLVAAGKLYLTAKKAREQARQRAETGKQPTDSQ